MEIEAKQVKIARINELIRRLNEASEVYYNGQEEIMPDYTWDEMFDELTLLETETGYRSPDSPTQKTGYQENNGEKERHEFPALSLAKTKKIAELQKWAEDKAIWLSWKLDGLTLVLTYDGGFLTKIVTRGNGEIGTNISFMKDAIKGFPTKIAYKGHMLVRGEATISYTDFDMINATIDEDEKYANPRNLASGTLSLDDVEKVKERHIHFNAFTLVAIDDDIKSWGARMDYLEELGFTVVDREATTADKLQEAIDRWTKKVESFEMDIPVDGLVICYDDIEYASTGSVTGHHATKAGYAFKWEDVAADTELEYIEWSCAASTISPVAVFKPVQIEGTTVKRASLCNISEMERLGIGGPSTICSVIKSNKIIPKIISIKRKVGEYEIPALCPACKAKTEIRISSKSNTKTLHCMNPDCAAKHVQKFTRFVSKTGMNIDGLSMQTMLRFINEGFIAKYADIYHLEQYFDVIKEMEGFGEKSCENMRNAIEKSRNVNPVNFLYALSIPMIAIDASKKIVETIGFDTFFDRISHGVGFEDIDGIGPEKSNSITEWYENPDNKATLEGLLKEVVLEKVKIKTNTDGKCAGLVFVITGEVHHYKNRDAFKAYVEETGGSVTGSVSGKTDYLVNNDIDSASSKNKKAKELGVPIITEDEFVEKFGA